MSGPKLILQLEGAAAMVAACVVYHYLHGSWLWFALLFLAPDLLMFGYLANVKWGSLVYNLGHTYLAPLLLFVALYFCGQTSFQWLAVIWFAHIGMDRMCGFGLKYPTAFKDTHLNRV